MTTKHTPNHFESLSAWLRAITRGPLERLASGLVKLKISPNALTVTGFLLTIVAALLAAQGAYFRSGIVFILGSLFDALDGSVARVGGKSSSFGALLDSTLDRYGEGVLLSGLGYSLSQQENWLALILVFTTLIGSFMVSYVRARSEGLGIDNKVGLLTRVERIVILFVMLLSGKIVVGLGILAVLTQFTVCQRLWYAYRVSIRKP
ncbi:MAG: CDP-alcohol phosphatidyltransferase family protein [Anaerolineae bacterium]|nr:CDP-alcohol phosphatidyltransferase family protein [Anaerolineae bacterium]